MPDGATMPGWPAMMRAEKAAMYLDMSQQAFRNHVAPHLPTLRITPAIVGYRRSDLDRWLATNGESPLPAPADDALAALEAARRENDRILDAD
jgi:hypothetical protein